MILEVGPGSGQNSLFLAASNPKQLMLVEPNQIGREQIKETYARHLPKFDGLTISASDLSEFETDIQYDLVIAECWIGSGDEDAELLKKLVGLASRDGTIILTATPAIGIVANSLRVALSLRLLKMSQMTFQTCTNILLNALTSHLDTLTDMSRFRKDWIQDNILNPVALTAIIHPLELIEKLSNCQLLASYPTFFESWRWYKSLYAEQYRPKTEWAEQYYMKAHNFLDVRVVSHEPRRASDNQDLERTCQLINSEVVRLRCHDCASATLVDLASQLLDKIPKSHGETHVALCEWIDVYERSDISQQTISSMKYFKSWFGRELMYISFTKN